MIRSPEGSERDSYLESLWRQRGKIVRTGHALDEAMPEAIASQEKYVGASCESINNREEQSLLGSRSRGSFFCAPLDHGFFIMGILSRRT